jgi:hypothetical protein
MLSVATTNVSQPANKRCCLRSQSPVYAMPTEESTEQREQRVGTLTTTRNIAHLSQQSKESKEWAHSLWRWCLRKANRPIEQRHSEPLRNGRIEATAILCRSSVWIGVSSLGGVRPEGSDETVDAPSAARKVTSVGECDGVVAHDGAKHCRIASALHGAACALDGGKGALARSSVALESNTAQRRAMLQRHLGEIGKVDGTEKRTRSRRDCSLHDCLEAVVVVGVQESSLSEAAAVSSGGGGSARSIIIRRIIIRRSSSFDGGKHSAVDKDAKMTCEHHKRAVWQ